MYTPSAAGRKSIMTVKTPGISQFIIFCCMGSIPCCGVMRCWPIIAAPRIKGSGPTLWKKSWSGAERSGNHRNDVW